MFARPDGRGYWMRARAASPGGMAKTCARRYAQYPGERDSARLAGRLQASCSPLPPHFAGHVVGAEHEGRAERHPMVQAPVTNRSTGPIEFGVGGGARVMHHIATAAPEADRMTSRRPGTATQAALGGSRTPRAAEKLNKLLRDPARGDVEERKGTGGLAPRYQLAKRLVARHGALSTTDGARSNTFV